MKTYVVRTTLVEIEGDEEMDLAICDSDEMSEKAASELFEEQCGEDPNECLIADEDEEEVIDVTAADE